MSDNADEGKALPVLDGRAWTGRGKYYGTTFVVELFESRKHPGYYHSATYCIDDDFCHESEKPMRADVLQEYLDTIVQRHGLVIADMEWTEAPNPGELPLLGERFLAGE